MTPLQAFGIKLALTIAILALVLMKVDLGSIRAALSRLDGTLIGWTVLLAGTQTALLAYRWRLISNFLGANLTFPFALRGTLISLFFSQGLPASIGGDVFRIWWLARETTADGGEAAHIVLLDRIIGFLSLVALSAASLVLIAGTIEGAGLGSIILIVATSAAGGMILLLPVPQGVLKLWRALLQRVPQKLRTILQWMSELKFLVMRLCADARLCLASFGIGIVVHLQTVMIAYLVVHALGYSLAFWQCLAVIPPVMLLAYLPISIAGWGAREATVMFGLQLFGVPPTVGFLVSVLIGLVILAVSLFGGALWLGTDLSSAFRRWQAKTIKQ
jgi:uncharacterized protein (TIRG00374 family)